MKSARWCMCLLAAVAAVLLSVQGARGEASVTDVEARQRYPWNGLVDIACKVTGIEGETTGLKFGVATVDGESGTAQDVSHVRVVKDGAESDDLTVTANGSYSLVWDARADLGEGQWSDMVVRVMITEDAPTPSGIQLWDGGPYWADRNIGAENPWDYGLYFWWGDTVGYKRVGDAWVASDGSVQNFSFDSGNTPTSNKRPNILQSEGWITTAGVLAPDHDAAHVQWGGDWRMPTEQELDNLCNKCGWLWTATNGVYGYLVRGRGDYASASIFLPAAGGGLDTALRYAGSYGNYWSSVPYSGENNSSWYSYFYSVRHVTYYCCPHNGISIRPVRGASK